MLFRSSHRDVFLGKGVVKICIKFTREYPCRSVISIKLQSSLIEITLRHGCSPINLLHIFRTLFTKTISERLLLVISYLNGEEIIGGFYEKELQKTNQEKFRIEKVIKRKGDKLFVKWKRYDNSFNSWIDKKGIERNFLM